jgi:MFS transporter, Spinster family, sphingosine-1-phosphate transporter
MCDTNPKAERRKAKNELLNRIFSKIKLKFFFFLFTQYVVVPTRRSTAEAFQILISHAFGDAGSPYFVGVLSEGLKGYVRTRAVQEMFNFGDGGIPKALAQLAENATTAMTTTTLAPTTEMAAKMMSGPSLLEVKTEFTSLQYALFSTCFVEVIGGAFFLLTSFYVLRDKKRVDDAVRGECRRATMLFKNQ